MSQDTRDGAPPDVRAGDGGAGGSQGAGGPVAPRGRALLAGLVTGLAGVAASGLVAALLGARTSPRVAVGETVISLTPGSVAESLIHLVGRNDKPALQAGVLVVLLGLAALAGALARRSLGRGQLLFLAMGVLGFVATATRPHAGFAETVPPVVGTAVWLLGLPLLVRVRGRVEVPGDDRRRFLTRVGGVAVGAAAAGVLGHLAGQGRRAVTRSRGLLRLPIKDPGTPLRTSLGVDGISPWQTSNSTFYRIDTALVVPTVRPEDWRLRIHGMVDREIRLSYDDLIARQMTDAWVTICCVSNPVGGPLIGNAFWSGVRVADLLAEAGVDPRADAVRQTSVDGWNCGTPVSALTDGRDALLAVGMNGEPLPIEHGFPVRMIVPGLYGYVSATKWVTDLEVTRFADFQAYWTERGWSAQGPVRTESRVDVPRDGEHVTAGTVRFGGVAWAQHTGIASVEFQVDGGAWRSARLGGVPGDDTWVQWTGEADVPPGGHQVAVRATDQSGYTQTPVRRGVIPDGATGWDQHPFTAA